MSAGNIGAIILAAGASSRLGQPKQLVTWRGESLVRHAARQACAAGCTPVVVVAGEDRLKIANELIGLPAGILPHPQWRQGIGSSLRAGVNHALTLQPGLDALLIMVCDQPLVTSQLLLDLIAARKKSASRSAACIYAGTIGVPALFDRSLFPALRDLHDNQGAKTILSTHATDIAQIPFPEGAIDIDTPTDLLTHRQRDSALETGARQPLSR